MAIEKIIVAAVIIILIWIVARSLFDKLSRALFIGGIAIVAVVAAAAFIVYEDIQDIKENFQQSSKKIVLADNSRVLTGFSLNGDIAFMPESRLDELSANLGKKDYKSMLGSSYRLMVFDVDIISGLDAGTISISGKQLDKNYAVAVLKSDNALAMLKSKGISEKDLSITKEEAKSDSRVKAALFGIILTNDILGPKDVLLLSGYKEGLIKIYPETALFKTVKYIPLSFIENAAKGLFATTKEAAKGLMDNKK